MSARARSYPSGRECPRHLRRRRPVVFGGISKTTCRRRRDPGDVSNRNGRPRETARSDRGKLARAAASVFIYLFSIRLPPRPGSSTERRELRLRKLGRSFIARVHRCDDARGDGGVFFASGSRTGPFSRRARQPRPICPRKSA